MSKLKIAVLRSDEPHHQYLDDILSAQFEVVASVIEPDTAQSLKLLRKGWKRAYFWRRFHSMRRMLFGLSSYRRKYFNRIEIPSNTGYTTIRIQVDDINNESVVELLKLTSPDITVVIGTSILKPRLLRANNGDIINIHGGFLPYYRGNHCFFFALLDEAYDKVGSTIHFVDEGVDTGNIIAHAIPLQCTSDTPESLYCRASALAIHTVTKLLSQLEQGVPLPRIKQDNTGRTYKTADRKLQHEIRYWTKWTARRIMNQPRIRNLSKLKTEKK
ncbi:formyltransferase family protein [Prosthecochloris sp. SCSIO W1101]|uniref:formyl transferase n=1 Tax=Prosthecochloris sp. SCSIO W1101 TaxID=2992242 RepID=UPI00223E140A|nr:formyltransferase family protein [Prosthecochloris sp. SCSIO W1101]UZJ42133.1 formyltransferase family protein [Prosthecochloris sp. SCSIO W1101]